MTIVDLSDMVAKVRINETDAVRLTPNDSVVVTVDAFPDTTFVGRVVRVRRGTADPASAGPPADFNADIELGALPSRIQPGLSCTTRIIVGVRPRALSIPIIALTLRDHVPVVDSALQAGAPVKSQKRRDIEGVFVIQDGIARFRAVKIGIVGDEHFEVVEGLREGETIVTGSYQAIRNLQDGTPIHVVDGPAAGVIAGDSASGGLQWQVDVTS
jgi:HlyD family secretion protein